MRLVFPIVSALLCCLASSAPPVAAAPRGATTVVVSAQRCVVDGVGPGGVAFSATLPDGGVAKVGMLLGVKTVDSHPQEVLDLVASFQAVRVEQGENRGGRWLEFRGYGFVESRGAAPVHDPRASGFVTEDGSFSLTIGDRTLAGRGERGFTFGSVPAPAAGDTATHEVGHWLGLYHTFDGKQVVDVFVAAPRGTGLEGYPEIACNFRETAEGETGHAHGHLDFIKQVGDPATGLPLAPDVSLEAKGLMTFAFGDDDAFDAQVLLRTDADTGRMQLRIPDLGRVLAGSYRALAPRGDRRNLLLHVTVW